MNNKDNNKMPNNPVKSPSQAPKKDWKLKTAAAGSVAFLLAGGTVITALTFAGGETTVLPPQTEQRTPVRPTHSQFKMAHKEIIKRRHEDLKSGKKDSIIWLTENDWIEVEQAIPEGWDSDFPATFSKTIDETEHFVEVYEEGWRVFCYASDSMTEAQYLNMQQHDSGAEEGLRFMTHDNIKNIEDWINDA